MVKVIAERYCSGLQSSFRLKSRCPDWPHLQTPASPYWASSLLSHKRHTYVIFVLGNLRQTLFDMRCKCDSCSHPEAEQPGVEQSGSQSPRSPYQESNYHQGSSLVACTPLRGSQMVPKSSPDADAGAGASASAAEKHATMAGSTPASVSVPTPKLRSCVICRRRKVRCDKVSPCSNCRRANIACIFPSNDRPPRWARRLERITNEAAGAAPDSPQGADLQSTHVMERLRNLESLVKELSGQLDQANATASSAGGGSGAASAGNSPASTAGSHARDAERGTKTYSTLGNTAPGVQEQFGRMVLKDANRGRYVSSGFWSRVDVGGS